MISLSVFVDFAEAANERIPTLLIQNPDVKKESKVSAANVSRPNEIISTADEAAPPANAKLEEAKQRST